jgi:hypothetical protein
MSKIRKGRDFMEKGVKKSPFRALSSEFKKNNQKNSYDKFYYLNRKGFRHFFLFPL